MRGFMLFFQLATDGKKSLFEVHEIALAFGVTFELKVDKQKSSRCRVRSDGGVEDPMY